MVYEATGCGFESRYAFSTVCLFTMLLLYS